MITIYVTKYACTEGVVERKAESISDNGKWAQCRSEYGYFEVFSNKAFYLDKEQAENDAAKRIQKKIAQLYKQIDKLEVLAASIGSDS